MTKTSAYSLAALLLLIFTSGNCQKAAVFFASDKAVLTPSARHTIDSILSKGGFTKLILKAYCDSIGTNDYNEKLSKKRVEAVKKYLLSKKVADSIIQVNPLGEISSRVQNETAGKRANNRRVDIEPVRRRYVASGRPGTQTKRLVKVSISGQVADENARPLEAEISVSDTKGKEVHKTTSGKDGRYSIEDTLFAGQEYSITFVNDSAFIGANTFTPSAQGLLLKDQQVKLPRLKEGSQYTIENLHFVGGEATLVTASKPTLHALYKLLKRNKNLVIKIEGHVNDPYFVGPGGKKIQRFTPGGPRYHQWLSEERAKTVFNFMKNRGIAAGRMSTAGFGSSRMLFPEARTEEEMEKNRRVEVLVEKID